MRAIEKKGGEVLHVDPQLLVDPTLFRLTVGKPFFCGTPVISDGETNV